MRRAFENAARQCWSQVVDGMSNDLTTISAVFSKPVVSVKGNLIIMKNKVLSVEIVQRFIFENRHERSLNDDQKRENEAVTHKVSAVFVGKPLARRNCGTWGPLFVTYALFALFERSLKSHKPTYQVLVHGIMVHKFGSPHVLKC